MSTERANGSTGDDVRAPEVEVHLLRHVVRLLSDALDPRTVEELWVADSWVGLAYSRALAADDDGLALRRCCNTFHRNDEGCGAAIGSSRDQP